MYRHHCRDVLEVGHGEVGAMKDVCVVAPQGCGQAQAPPTTPYSAHRSGMAFEIRPSLIRRLEGLIGKQVNPVAFKLGGQRFGEFPSVSPDSPSGDG